jgi:signal transduction histidine kinase
MARPRARVAIGALAALLALIQAQAIEQALRSHARVRGEVLQATRAATGAVLPGLAERARAGWKEAAAPVLESGLAAELEVFDQEGQRLQAFPQPSPVQHWLDREELEELRSQRVLAFGPLSGGETRFLGYGSVVAEGADRPLVVRLSRAVPAVAADLADFRRLLLIQGVGFLALVVLAALALAPGAESSSSRQPALDAYEQVVQQLQARGLSLTRQHAAEKERMEQAFAERAAMARAGELTAGIVHEMRNGLATIVGHARLLESAPEAREAARTILQECGTLETVVRRFLDFIREDSLEMAPFDLGRFLSRVVGREGRAHPDCDVQLAPGDAGLLVGDEDMLERALENLVRNALEAAGSGGRVRVGVDRAPGLVSIRIEDDGPGLDASLGPQPRAFVSTKPGGTGLGLPIADKIVRLHGGRLRLEPVAPRGLRATVELPVIGANP